MHKIFYWKNIYRVNSFLLLLKSTRSFLWIKWTCVCNWVFRVCPQIIIGVYLLAYRLKKNPGIKTYPKKYHLSSGIYFRWLALKLHFEGLSFDWFFSKWLLWCCMVDLSKIVIPFLWLPVTWKLSQLFHTWFLWCAKSFYLESR